MFIGQTLFRLIQDIDYRALVEQILLSWWDVKPESTHLQREKRFQSAFEIADGCQLHMPIDLLVNKKNYNFQQVHVLHLIATCIA